ncbi:glycerol-3-phosphate 1-O-acyltransferase PlsY [Tsuneonella mangrovi]|uniref:glycerol-3-phosphate 1-O-acyltransferase PlsY n=1 Tax=Tsuneonella mangrovi TaxID=1982042 RepID=UPI000BA22722|nr:glycerol-3-phosphate 1-O-acyltransferase PlsY [Tsuneonella mangrovi]
MELLFAALTGYLLGSIPFGLLLTRFGGAGDVRQIGSGSIGATNVLRTGRKGLAAATVLLDAGKGLVAVLLADRLWPGMAGVAAVAAIAGHCFPLWLKFKGGKGFATAAGVCLALSWQVMLACAAVWAATLAISRISSVSSMTTVIAAPILAWLLGFPSIVTTLVAVAAIVIIQHRANIGRLMRGEEPKVGSKK